MILFHHQKNYFNVITLLKWIARTEHRKKDLCIFVRTEYGKKDLCLFVRTEHRKKDFCISFGCKAFNSRGKEESATAKCKARGSPILHTWGSLRDASADAGDYESVRHRKHCASQSQHHGTERFTAFDRSSKSWTLNHRQIRQRGMFQINFEFSQIEAAYILSQSHSRPATCPRCPKSAVTHLNFCYWDRENIMNLCLLIDNTILWASGAKYLPLPSWTKVITQVAPIFLYWRLFPIRWHEYWRHVNSKGA
jgi:hypothetical protein